MINVRQSDCHNTDDSDKLYYASTQAVLCVSVKILTLVVVQWSCFEMLCSSLIVVMCIE